MLRLYQLIFWVPTAVSVIALRALWFEDALPRPLLVLSWLVLAFALQYWGSPLVSALGLALQTALALYALIQWKLRL